MSDKTRVLIIEDEPQVSALFADSLESSGMECDTARSLESGEAKLVEGDYDAVILDLNLPDSEGTSTLNRILLADAETPVVVVTGLGGDEDMALTCLEMGASDYVPKSSLPFSVLGRILNRSIARERGRRRRLGLLAKLIRGEGRAGS